MHDGGGSCTLFGMHTEGTGTPVPREDERQLATSAISSSTLHRSPKYRGTVPLDASHTRNSFIQCRSRRWIYHWPEITTHDLQKRKACLQASPRLSEPYPRKLQLHKDPISPSSCIELSFFRLRLQRYLVDLTLSRPKPVVTATVARPSTRPKGKLTMSSNVVPVGLPLHAKWFTLVTSFYPLSALCLFAWVVPFGYPTTCCSGEGVSGCD